MGTYGEFIKTPAAKAEADSHIRRFINDSLKQLPGTKLVKYQTGKPGTLDYGRVVVMLTQPPGDTRKKLLEIKNRKITDTYWVMHADFGKITRAYGDVYPADAMKTYFQKASAEKKYQEYVRWYLKG